MSSEGWLSGNSQLRTEKKMPYCCRHFFSLFQFVTLHVADRSNQVGSSHPRICHSVHNSISAVTRTSTKFVSFQLLIFFHNSRLKTVFFLNLIAFLLHSWLLDQWSAGHCGWVVHTEVKISKEEEEWSNFWQQRQLQRSALIATQIVRNWFCCPKQDNLLPPSRQWSECYDCQATWCEELATKRFCCPWG